MTDFPSIVNDPAIAKLCEVLEAHDAQPNVLTTEQLLRFLPVISNVEAQQFLRNNPGNRGLSMLNQLQKEFCAATPRLYAPTIVVVSTTDPTVVFEFPPRLTEVQSIKPDLESMLVSGANTNAVQHDPDSIHSARTLNILLGMFGKAQLDPDHIAAVADVRRRSEDIVNRMDALQNRKSYSTQTHKLTSTNVMLDVDFDLDD